MEYEIPQLSLRFIPVWQRNLAVWRKLMVSSLLGNFGEPLLYLLAFGYGFGRMVSTVDGMPYIVFLASGIVCSSAMNSASFEAMYSAYTRMHVQGTWSAMISAPLNVDDVVLGEIVWAATKALINAFAILIVAVLLGLVADLRAILVLPVVLLTGFSFAALAMVVTAVSRSYDSFMYYFTLVLTPMLLLSGVFFPLSQLPGFIAGIAQLLPLAHAVAIIRPLMTGAMPSWLIIHLLVLILYGAAGFMAATHLLRQRLLS